MAEDAVLEEHGEVANGGRDGEFEVESKVERALRACIDSHPLASGVCDGTAESAWNNSLLSSAKLRALESIVPKQSRVKYEKDYQGFKTWCVKFGIDVSKVKVSDVLSWLEMMSEEYKLSSLWTKLSGIKCMLLYYHNTDTDSWKARVSAYMRAKAKEKKEAVKKAPVLNGLEVDRVWGLDEDKYLNELMAFAMGLYGGLRKQDYIGICHSDISVLRGVCM